MRAALWIGVLSATVVGWTACATTEEVETDNATPAGGLDLESTAKDVYKRCVRVQGAAATDALFDCGPLSLALHVGDDGQAFLDAGTPMLILASLGFAFTCVAAAALVVHQRDY